MNNTQFDVLGIGNAIFDILTHVEEDFLVKENLIKGSMRLIDSEEAVSLYNKIGSATRIPGGCAGNTVASVISLGGTAAYIGKVANDELGEAYRHDMNGIGAYFKTPSYNVTTPTAKSMILVTPDGERTMNTYLGACVELTESDIDPYTVGNAVVTYLEGYLWDPDDAKDAFRKAIKLAHASGRKTAMTLSDSFCVDRYRSEFLELIQNGSLDIVFANEHELKALYQTADLDSAIHEIRQQAKIAVITLGDAGSICVTTDEYYNVPAFKVDKIVDLTGAGDVFAAGFLYAYVREFSLAKCAELGSLAAAEVISHFGPRPETPLQEYAEQRGFVF